MIPQKETTKESKPSKFSEKKLLIVNESAPFPSSLFKGSYFKFLVSSQAILGSSKQGKENQEAQFLHKIG